MMPDALNICEITGSERLTHRQLSDRYLYFSQRWMEKWVSRPYLKLVDTEQLANETVLRVIQWTSKQSESSSLLIRDLDRVCRTIARRVAIQAIRDAKRFKRYDAVLAISLDDYIGEKCFNCEVDPQHIAIHREFVDNVLKSLDSSEAALLELRLQGWTNPEIANHVGSTTRGVKSQFNIIEKKLSHRLQLGQKPEASCKPQTAGLKTQDSRLRTQDSGLRTRNGNFFRIFSRLIGSGDRFWSI